MHDYSMELRESLERTHTFVRQFLIKSYVSTQEKLIFLKSNPTRVRVIANASAEVLSEFCGESTKSYSQDDARKH